MSERLDWKSTVWSSAGLTVTSLSVVTVFFVAVVASIRLCRHHHFLLMLVALGLLGAAWAQGLGEKGK
jgi:hypothetical protein